MTGFLLISQCSPPPAATHIPLCQALIYWVGTPPREVMGSLEALSPKLLCSGGVPS